MLLTDDAVTLILNIVVIYLSNTLTDLSSYVPPSVTFQPDIVVCLLLLSSDNLSSAIPSAIIETTIRFVTGPGPTEHYRLLSNI